MTQHLEQETKFLLDSWEHGERLLSGLGASLQKARHFERNALFDFPDGRLASQNCALRVREVEETGLLTFKGAARPPERGIAGIKEREELETALGCAQTCEDIFDRLGMVVRFRYEKFRAIYRAGDTLLTLDQVPIGTFLEIEGNPEAITQLAARLGLSMDAAIALSYPHLYRQARKRDPSLPEFMVFGK